MKYAIIRDGALEFPVFCLAPVTHSDLAAAWRRGDSRTVVSAGFVEFAAAGVRTFGRSVSLQLGPRSEDAKLIETFYTHTLRMAKALEDPARIEVRVADNDRGGVSLFPANAAARALMGEGETGNFATHADACRRARWNAWEVVK